MLRAWGFNACRIDQLRHIGQFSRAVCANQEADGFFGECTSSADEPQSPCSPIEYQPLTSDLLRTGAPSLPHLGCNLQDTPPLASSSAGPPPIALASTLHALSSATIFYSGLSATPQHHVPHLTQDSASPSPGLSHPHAPSSLGPQPWHAWHPLQTRHFASPSGGKGGAAKGAASKGKGAQAKGGASKGGKPGGTGPSGGVTAAPQDAPKPSSKVPEWAHMPSDLTHLQRQIFRRRDKVAKLQVHLRAEVARLEGQGWTAAAQRDKLAAEAEAMPVAPKDGGKAQLEAASAPGTSFEGALDILQELARVGIVLAVEPTLSGLLRKAASGDQLRAALGLLRRNHLTQAAVQVGAHGPIHNPLHEMLLQECKRVGSASPLLELWDSLYEHGMTPSHGSACAAVQTAVAVGDGRTAVALLGLTSLYGLEPLAAETVPAVVKLVEAGAGSPEDTATLRQLLPQIGM